MDAARPLRDVFAELASDESARHAYRSDPQGFLRANGHGELPSGLVAEAVVSYADLAPLETAEHLAPVVAAHSAVPLDGTGLGDDEGMNDPFAGLDLLASAPAAPAASAVFEEGAEMDDGGGTPDSTSDDDLDVRFGEGDPDALDHPGAGESVDVVEELDELAGEPGRPQVGLGDTGADASHEELDGGVFDDGIMDGGILDEVDGPPEEPEEDIADM